MQYNLDECEGKMMNKISIPGSNQFCPQPLFLFGTNQDGNTPDFGLFCWFSYCWNHELQVMACIGGNKLTKDRIRASGIFSAGLVTEAILPQADYFGYHEGYSKSKMKIPLTIEKGQVLDVPVLCECPWTFELSVVKTMELDGGEVYICRIVNVLADERLLDQSKTIEERVRMIRPVTSVDETYFSWDGSVIGKWGEPMQQFKRENGIL